jgi:flagellar hook-length control protein FliK
VDYGTFSGLGPIVPILPGAGGVAAGPANLLVEVVFVDPSAKGGSSSGNENSESGAKDKEKESPPDLGVTAARTLDTPGSNRFALQSKVEEPRNALHESILAQVKASVVSHDGKGNGTITVRLNPAELGDLQVNVRIENQRVMVEVISDNRSVRDALMGNLDSLKETLLKQNLNMERFNVSSGGGNGFGQGFREERGDQRNFSSLPFGHEAVPLESVRESGEDDWGVTENSLVNLRL